MNNFAHKEIIKAISKLDEMPLNSKDYAEWIQAEAHLEFLRQNGLADELVIYASGEYSFIHSVVVSNDRLSPVDQDDLIGWNSNPYYSIASYVTGGGHNDVWIERGLSGTSTKTLSNALQLIFGRTFEGWTDLGRNYFELHQEYAHITGIHWRPEKRAYCRFNEDGDIESLVTITTREHKESNLSLVTFSWKPLEEYLTASNSSIVRMFDFTLYRQSEFSGWPNEQPQEFYDSEYFFYCGQVLPGYAAYTRGVQIICPRRPKEAVFREMTDGWFGQRNKEYAEFIAYDWRNMRVAKISTDPCATANYFNADGNALPFELSPAFFRPEVLLKYKTDRDKYTVSERNVSCRAAWHLRGIDVNEAGQVHAYICYLRNLPYTEQLHWLSFNEKPKASISDRAIINDFKGEFVSFEAPLQKILSIVRRWHTNKIRCWTLRDEKLLERVNTPLTESRDEWAEAFMDLAKLVVEGFNTRPLRVKLREEQVLYDNEERPILLIEKLLKQKTALGESQNLAGLRTVQSLRSKVKGHAGGSEAEKLAHDVLMEHETYGNHFRFVCDQVIDDLILIEKFIS